jgi:DNA-directed RNA polymerase I, II, and III subunit RPABC2
VVWEEWAEWEAWAAWECPPAQERTKETNKKNEVTVGPAKLTRFERARIVGARALQIAMGAPILVEVQKSCGGPIDIALLELDSGILPMTIRRTLPNGICQDIPLKWLQQA